MRDAARSQHRFPRMKVQPLLANLKRHFPFHDVEPFLLIQVQVQRRATRQEMLVLDDEESASRLTGGDFEEERAESQRVRMAEAVLPGANRMQCNRWRRHGCPGARLTGEKIVQSRSGINDSGGSEKGTALHGPPFAEFGKASIG